MANSISEVFKPILTMHTTWPQNNIHIPVTVHISHHQFPVLYSTAFKIEVHDINSTRVCQLPEPITGKLVNIKTVYVDQTDIRFSITIIIHRNQSIGMQCPTICLVQCKVKTGSIINRFTAIQVYQQGT